MLDAGDIYHSIGSQNRFFGIHNMQVCVPGYKPIHLVQDDICEYPYLFTILGTVTPEFLKYNYLTQRWALVKYFMPLYFGFEIKGDRLVITSALSKYYVFAPCMAKQIFDLVPLDNGEEVQFIDAIEVRVNGRGVVLRNQVLELYHPGFFAILSKFFWPLKLLI